MKTTASNAKISFTKKSFEEQNLISFNKRINAYLTELGTDPWKRRKVLNLLKRDITLDNITKVYNHHIDTFLEFYLQGKLIELYSFSEQRTPKVEGEVL